MKHGSMTLRDLRVVASVTALNEASADEVFARMRSVYSVAPMPNEISRTLLALCGRGVLRARAVEGVTRFSAA